MNYHNITVDDMLNGDGLRTVLWVSGCEHRCRGCQNPQTWPEHSGVPFDDAAREELFGYLSRDYISGVTFSGGDPLFPANRETVGALVREIREHFPQKTIWLYTGSLFEDVAIIECNRADKVNFEFATGRILKNITTEERFKRVKNKVVDFLSFDIFQKERSDRRKKTIPLGFLVDAGDYRHAVKVILFKKFFA